MALSKRDLENQREQMQCDLQCVLDGIDDDVITNACQVVVDRINSLIDKFDGDDLITLLREVGNDFETEGCQGCGTVSVTTMNKVRTILGWEPLKEE